MHAQRPADTPWYRTITATEWRVLTAAKMGWMLDAFDFMLYAMALGHIRQAFQVGDATLGMLGTVTLLMSGAGGVGFGYVADRFGRTRALMGTIVVFSLASLGAATSHTVWQLMAWRALLGLGMGGEWAAGAVLVSETWPPAHRDKAIGIMQSGWAIGYVLAALAAGALLDREFLGIAGWRWLFAAGVLPALFAIWIRRSVPEPAAWRTTRAPGRDANPFRLILGPALAGRTVRITLLCAATQFAYWGVFFWLPAFLARPAADGGAGMTVVHSFAWILAIQAGAYAGYLTFGFLAAAWGRRRTFVVFMIAAAAVVPLYAQMARSPLALLWLGPVVGYFGSGHFSMFGSFVAELFPAEARGTGQGLVYNLGRMAGAVAPFTIGALASLPDVGIALALSLTSAFFLLAAGLTFTLPDRSGRPLDA